MTNSPDSAPLPDNAQAPVTAADPFRVLMCAPDSFDVRYEINDWMSLNNLPDVALAARQWHALYKTLTEELRVTVELVRQAPDAPDMVFTANAGIVDRRPGVAPRALLSAFRHKERQVEVPHFRAWFEEHGYRCEAPVGEFKFEGEGDALFAGEALVAGYMRRSDIGAHRWLADQLGVQVISVELVQGRWYHLDTAFFSLGGSRGLLSGGVRRLCAAGHP